MSERARNAVRALLAVAILVRLAYHVIYLALDPFALATFSDGALYERAARDLLAHPPLGSEPFYLQGAYAYLLALGMAATHSALGGLLAQGLVALLGLLAAAWALGRAFGRDAGLLSALALLSYFPLAFCENKYLSATLGVSSLFFVWAAFAWYVQAAESRGRPRLASVVLGLAAALASLARPNMLLAVPFTALAILRSGGRDRRAHLLPWALGLLLGFAPMLLRNYEVTGHASVFPAHAGGTSFYIGNNPHADGRWNTAGGWFSGQVGLERAELLRRLELAPGDVQSEAGAIGSALYRRAFAFIRAEPRAYLALELKKLWLTFGNDELSQDYDRLGERELIGPLFGWGIPFAFLLSQGFVGAVMLVRARGERHNASWLWLLGGQLLAVLLANLLYFTSSQHRLPLAALGAALAGLALESLVVRLSPAGSARSLPPRWALALAALLCLQAFVPREHRERPSVAHYYNLSVVETQNGNLMAAALSLDQALARRPSEPTFLVEQAALFRQLGRFELAAQLLARLRAQPALPAWIVARAQREQALNLQRRTEPFNAAGAP